jgi:hypothetical protein
MYDALERTETIKMLVRKPEGKRLLGRPRRRWSTRFYSWLKHYATSCKVAGSIVDEVIGFFNRPNCSSRTMALRSTQPLIEMITRKLPGGLKNGGRVRLTTLPPSMSRLFRKMWKPRCLTTLWASTACYTDSFTFLRQYNREG